MHGGCRVSRLSFTPVDVAATAGSQLAEAETENRTGTWSESAPAVSEGSMARWQVVEEAHVHHTDAARNPQHLAYGVDVLSCAPIAGTSTAGAREEAGGVERAEREDGKLDIQIASCSFYDNLIQLWQCSL